MIQVVWHPHQNTQELETLSIRCRPYYLPREFQSVILTVVYIPPEASEEDANRQLSDIVNKNENCHPGAISIIAGDFNHVNFKKRMPKFYQHVDCHTRKRKTLDHCYTPIKEAYRSLQRAPLGDSDHCMVFLVPKYRHQLKRQKPVVRIIPQWSVPATERLQGCFGCTDWNMFLNVADNIETCTDVILDYIRFCEGICITTKVVKLYPNNKPRFGHSCVIY